jgi:hypothetical protein
VEQLDAGCGTERIEAFSLSALDLLKVHWVKR